MQYGLFIFHNAPNALLLSWLGRLVILRTPGNRIGPIMMVIAGLGAAHYAVAAFADLEIVRWGYDAAITSDHPLIPAEMPLSASVPFWIMNWLWLPQVVLLLTVLPVIFPDGSLPGPRWRVAFWLAGTGGAVFMAGLVLDAWPTSQFGTATPTHPVVGTREASGSEVDLSQDHFLSGGPEGFHLGAPTDPGVNLSVHRAPVTLVTRRAGPKVSMASARTCGDIAV